MDMTRRGFVGAAAMAAGGLFAVPKKDDFIWAALFHMGTNMWCDQPVTSWGPYKGEDELSLVCAADHLRLTRRCGVR